MTVTFRRWKRGTPDLPIYRVRFHRVDDSDPRAELAASGSLSPTELAALRARLARLDRSHGPWTLAVLDAIAARPGVRAADLAAGLGRDASRSSSTSASSRTSG